MANTYYILYFEYLKWPNNRSPDCNVDFLRHPQSFFGNAEKYHSYSKIWRYITLQKISLWSNKLFFLYCHNNVDILHNNVDILHKVSFTCSFFEDERFGSDAVRRVANERIFRPRSPQSYLVEKQTTKKEQRYEERRQRPIV